MKKAQLNGSLGKVPSLPEHSPGLLDALWALYPYKVFRDISVDCLPTSCNPAVKSRDEFGWNLKE